MVYGVHVCVYSMLCMFLGWGSMCMSNACTVHLCHVCVAAKFDFENVSVFVYACACLCMYVCILCQCSFSLPKAPVNVWIGLLEAWNSNFQWLFALILESLTAYTANDYLHKGSWTIMGAGKGKTHKTELPKRHSPDSWLIAEHPNLSLQILTSSNPIIPHTHTRHQAQNTAFHDTQKHSNSENRKAHSSWCVSGSSLIVECLVWITPCLRNTGALWEWITVKGEETEQDYQKGREMYEGGVRGAWIVYCVGCMLLVFSNNHT